MKIKILAAFFSTLLSISLCNLLAVYSAQAEDQRDPNWRWSNSISNPNNADYKVKNSSRDFTNSPTNPNNLPGNPARVDVIEKNLLKLIERNVGYAVERDRLPTGQGIYINIFDNDGTRVGYCPELSFALLKSRRSDAKSDVVVKDDAPICFDLSGDPEEFIFRFNS